MLAISDIDAAIEGLLPEVIEIRHGLHARPELSLREFNTSRFIRDQLSKLDIEVLPPFLETDVVAFLQSKKNGRNVTLRADLDALPVFEENTFAYCSENRGVMHACGHDGHTAMLLGAAMVMVQFRGQMEGSVRFVFQPGEEVVAAGKDLVEKGILTDPRPDVVLALHGWPGFPTGTICSRPGEMMAAADFFKIRIRGEGGHDSRSDQRNNPIVLASRIVNSLTTIPERDFRGQDGVVISITKLIGGTSSNIIPNEVTIEGSTRYFNKTVGQKMPDLFKAVLDSECNPAMLLYELDYRSPYLATVNNPDIVQDCRNITRQFAGDSAWIDMGEPVMSSEDFSYYIKDHPGAMFFLGMGEDSPGLHTSIYDFNDKAIRQGIMFFVLSTFHYLSPNRLLYK